MTVGCIGPSAEAQSGATRSTSCAGEFTPTTLPYVEPSSGALSSCTGRPSLWIKLGVDSGGSACWIGHAGVAKIGEIFLPQAIARRVDEGIELSLRTSETEFGTGRKIGSVRWTSVHRRQAGQLARAAW